MRDNLLAIETLHSQLLLLSRDPKFGLEPLRCDWGRVGSGEYGMKLSQFRRGIRQLAMACPVKWYRGSYYLFNGKVYEPAEQDVIEVAYQQLVEDMAVTAAMNKASIMDEVEYSLMELLALVSVLHVGVKEVYALIRILVVFSLHPEGGQQSNGV